MKILAIESSCDETAAAVVEDGAKILSNVVVSQIDIFAEYGGVIPEVAARSHLEAILPVIHKAMEEAGAGKDDIDAIAVTHTPGLLGSLLIGTLTARVLAILWEKPLYAVHHLKSHIYANWLKAGETGDQSRLFSEPAASRPVVTGETCFARSSLVAKSSEKELRLFSTSPGFPLVALIVSGGHTQIIYMEGHNQFEIIGTTRDDAVGECFDKVAKVLGLPYPGGPSIAKVALSSAISSLSSPVRSRRMSNTAPLRASNSPRTSAKLDATSDLPRTSSNLSATLSSSRTSSKSEAIEKEQWYKEHPNYKLPHPKVEGLDFSFSGLKTAVLRAVQAELGVPISTPSYELAGMMTEQQKADFAAAFRETAVDILIEKLKMALEAHPEACTVVLGGGVSADKLLRKRVLEELSEGSNGKIEVFFPELKYAGDNAAMVGAAAYYEIMSGVEPTDPYKLSIAPRTPIYS